MSLDFLLVCFTFCFAFQALDGCQHQTLLVSIFFKYFIFVECFLGGEYFFPQLGRTLEIAFGAFL